MLWYGVPPGHPLHPDRSVSQNGCRCTRSSLLFLISAANFPQIPPHVLRLHMHSHYRIPASAHTTDPAYRTVLLFSPRDVPSGCDAAFALNVTTSSGLHCSIATIQVRIFVVLAFGSAVCASFPYKRRPLSPSTMAQDFEYSVCASGSFCFSAKTGSLIRHPITSNRLTIFVQILFET